MKEKIKKIMVFICFYFLFLYNSLIYLVPLKLLNISYNNLNANIKVLLSITASITISLIMIIVYRKDLKVMFNDYKKNYKNYFDLGLKCYFVGLLIMCLSNALIGIFTPVHEANNEVLVQNMLKTTPILSFISASFCAPFLEEMLFRKSLGDIFDNKYIKIFMCGLVFGLLHVVFSMNSLYDLLYIIPYGALGSAFACILTKKNNIFIPITFHMLHNGILTLISIIGYLL